MNFKGTHIGQLSEPAIWAIDVSHEITKSKFLINEIVSMKASSELSNSSKILIFLEFLLVPGHRDHCVSGD